MRILIHTQYFPPEVGAPQNRLSEFAKYLSGNSCQVIILTAMPNYPLGKLYPGYTRLFKKEVFDSYVVYRSAIIPTQKTSLIPRLLCYLSFAISSFFLGLFIPRPDVIITESPPIFLGFFGFLLGKLKKAKWILNVSDLWPLSVYELGVIKKESIGYRISEKLENFLYSKAWIITGQSSGIINYINNRTNTDSFTLPNGVDLSRFIVTPKTIPSSEINIVYAGLHGLAQGLDQILQAAQSFLEYPNVKFDFYGDGPLKKELVDYKNKNRINNVTFFDSVSSEKIPKILIESHIILIPLKIQLTGAIPSKLFEAMAAGKPIILIAESEAAEIVRSSDCGLCVRPGDIDGIVQAIKYLVDNPLERGRLGTNGKVAAEQRFNRIKIYRNFYNFLVDKLEQR